MRLRIHRWLERSVANGPGERFVLWVQGCTLGCRGCFNPQTWPGGAGTPVDTAVIARRVHSVPGLRGVTLSGGEPLQQPEAVAELLDRLDPALDRLLFTGFTRREIEADERRRDAARRADLVIAGRYRAARAARAGPWADPWSKELIANTGRISPTEAPECRVEALIRPDGTVALTGFPPADLLRAGEAAPPPASGAQTPEPKDPRS